MSTPHSNSTSWVDSPSPKHLDPSLDFVMLDAPSPPARSESPAELAAVSQMQTMSLDPDTVYHSPPGPEEHCK